MFSTAHTHGIATVTRTFRNQIKNSAGTENPALSRDAIVTARKDALTLLDAEGHVRPVKLNTLIVTPTNEDLAMRLLFSDKISGSANNDTNELLRSKVPNLIVWERLETDGQGTSRSNYWFMCEQGAMKVGETLRALFAERPSLDPPEQVYKNKNQTNSFLWNISKKIEQFFQIPQAAFAA